jgi:hypothetical protein
VNHIVIFVSAAAVCYYEIHFWIGDRIFTPGVLVLKTVILNEEMLLWLFQMNLEQKSYVTSM